MSMYENDYPEEESRYEQESIFMGFLGDFFSRPLNIAAAAFVIGVLFGWIVLGWGLWPVDWEDASIQEVRPDLQIEYMRMVVDSYNLRNDWPLAQQRINELGEDAPIILQTLAQNPGDEISQETLNTFLQVYGTGGGVTAPESPSGSTQPDTGDTSSTGSALLVACAVTFLLAGALAVVYFMRRGRRPRGQSEQTAAMRAQEFSRQAEQTDYEALGEERPIAQYTTTYLVGDDLFDDSFSIDSPTGEFLGECGVGIADTIGVGEPKRVSAFEVWLFDKNDIKTITKVLMSHHIYHDEAGHNRLAAKGEPILAQPNTEVILMTETLQMVVRIIDMTYGEGALPENSFFDRIILELAVWTN